MGGIVALALSLHLLQICLVYVNTLMLQQVLGEAAWMDRMREEDFRALSPLIHSHVNPYGSFELDMENRWLSHNLSEKSSFLESRAKPSARRQGLASPRLLRPKHHVREGSSSMAKTAPPQRRASHEYRSREYLPPSEVEQVVTAAGKLGRHGHRDSTMILLAYRHGLRVSELIALLWEQVDLKQGALHVRRRMNGTPSSHPLHGPEIRALRKVAREYQETRYVFVTERKGPLSDSAFCKIVARAGGFLGRLTPRLSRRTPGDSFSGIEASRERKGRIR